MRHSDQYADKFKKSKALYERSAQLFPRGVCHDIRFYPPFPVVCERGAGAFQYDVDGHLIIDLWCGHYANILGNNHPAIVDAVQKAADKSIHLGTLNPYQIEFASLLQEAVPELERLRFCTSGTEATMYVSRVAKAFTGRNTIAKMEGGWHGGNTELTHAIKPPFAESASQGINRKIDPLPVPYNETEKARAILEAAKDDLAAIIMEPVLGAGGAIVANPDFLVMIREFCDKNGTLLIFDEVITGFRYRWGSIWPELGIKPDLFTFGKITGGGMHIGIYGGRKDVMDVITSRKIVTGGGTFSANPLTMHAGIAALTALRTANYSALNAAGVTIRKKLDALIKKHGLNAIATGYGSFFAIHFLTRSPEGIDPTCPSCFLQYNDAEADAAFKIIMLNYDVFTMHNGGAISFAHLHDGVIEKLLLAYDVALADMKALHG